MKPTFRHLAAGLGMALSSALVVLPAAQAAPSTPMGQATGDATITAKIEARLQAAPDLKTVQINVSTHDGVVTLAGVLASPAMRSEAIRIADSVHGVRKVDTQNLTVRRG